MNPVIFWGSPEFAVPSLKKLAERGLIRAVITKPDSEQGRGQSVDMSPVKKVATELGLSILTPEALDETFIASLQPYLPATFLVIAYGKIIPDAVLQLSELPALNIHPSRLPRWRGASPIQSALLANEPETAVTLMQLDAQMDHGPIVAQRELPIYPSDYYLDLEKRLAETSAQLLAEKLPQYLEGVTTAEEQNHVAATLCKKLSKEDGLIMWDDAATEVRNKIRAYTPWPSAYFFWNDKRFIISKADLAENPDHKPAGTWWKEGDNLLVACGIAALQVLEIQPEGKNKMSAAEFANGYKIVTS